MLLPQIVQQSNNSMKIDDINEKENASSPKIKSNMTDDDDSVSSDSSSSTSCNDLLNVHKQHGFDDMSLECFSARSTTVPLLRDFT